jgi:hypothetical protein
MATRTEATEVKADLVEKLVNRFNHASFPLIGTIRVQKVEDGYGLRVGLLRDLNPHEDRELPSTFEGVPVSYVPEAPVRKFS